MSVPITKLLAFELARNNAALISSSDWPKRPRGVWPQMALVRAVGEPSSLNSSLRFCSAGKKPGGMVLTRTPFGPHSPARKRDRLRSAPLAADEATPPQTPTPADTPHIMYI